MKTCTSAALFIPNVITICLLFIGFILRLVYCFSSSEYDPGTGKKEMRSNFNFFFLMTTLYYLIFLVILLVGVLGNNQCCKSGRNKQFINFVMRQFKMVEGKLGRGLMIIFLSFLVLEVPQVGEIVVASLCIIVGAINIWISCSETEQPSDEKYEDDEEEP